MLHNKKKNWKPFDMNKKPVKQYPFLVPLIWGASWLMTRRFSLKIEKENMEHIRPPYLVLSTHQGFSDYYIAPLALFPHRANYVSDMEGFAAFGEWLYRGIGCIGKRRYVSDVAVVKNIYYALHNKKQIVAVFPESRHSNVGTTSRIPGNMGKLAKLMKVPVVTLSVHGSYLAGPFWDEEHIRTVPMEARLTCIYTAQELERAGYEEVQQKIEEKLQYDEYRWQKEKGIAIRYKNRRKGFIWRFISAGHAKRLFVWRAAAVCCAVPPVGRSGIWTSTGSCIGKGKYRGFPTGMSGSAGTWRRKFFGESTAVTCLSVWKRFSMPPVLSLWERGG